MGLLARLLAVLEGKAKRDGVVMFFGWSLEPSAFTVPVVTTDVVSLTFFLLPGPRLDAGLWCAGAKPFLISAPRRPPECFFLLEKPTATCPRLYQQPPPPRTLPSARGPLPSLR